MYTVRLGDTIDLPCPKNLEEPVSIEWSRERSSLPADVRQNEVKIFPRSTSVFNYYAIFIYINVLRKISIYRSTITVSR